jgi:hypothetical protein
VSEHDNEALVEDDSPTIYQPTVERYPARTRDEPRPHDDVIVEDPTVKGLLEPRPRDEGPLSSLSDEQRVRVAALNMAKPLLTSKGLLGATGDVDLSDLLRLATWILDGNEEPLYPFQSGDTLVLGPEIFVAIDGDVICWKGKNFYVREEDQ